LPTETGGFIASRGAGWLLWGLLAAALVLLYEAWTHALLTVRVTAELPPFIPPPFQAFTVIDETRSVVSMVTRLIETGYVTIAVLIVIFGMALPVLKNLGVAALLVFTRPGQGGGRTARALQFIGRFAMVDVFAIAIVVSIMAASTIGKGDTGAMAAIHTVTELKLGFWLFIAYVLLTFAIDAMMALRYPPQGWRHGHDAAAFAR
jgi:uncharacterized paraquat-inducible protein A